MTKPKQKRYTPKRSDGAAATGAVANVAARTIAKKRRGYMSKVRVMRGCWLEYPG